MKLTDRIKDIVGIEDAYWDSQRNRLVVYYHTSMDLDIVKARVAGAIGDANLQRAVDTITLIRL